ncbi:MAG: hypothetical protein ACYC5L_11390 [Bellilinea sp.]
METTTTILHKNPPSFLDRMIQAAINIWEAPYGAMFFAAFVYLGVSLYSGRIFTVSRFPYFNYLADAFLNGQFWFRQIPPKTHDLVYFAGNYSLYQSPFPAFVILPFIRIFGIGLNDVVYTALFAILNVGLVAQLLRVTTKNQFMRLSKIQRSGLVFFFTLGTVHFALAPNGNVWNTALILGFTCTILAYLAAFSLSGPKAWFFTGLALTGAMLTRNHLVFTGIFPAVYLLTRENPWNWSRAFRNLALAALPLMVGLGFLLYYNQARFGNPLDNGIACHQMADFFRDNFEQYGAFNLHYVPINLYYQYIFYPFPISNESFMGGSLFLLSPLFFGALGAFWKPRQKWPVWILTLSILFTTIPILLLMGTGWVQFGPRYTLDFTVPLLLLTALGIERWKPAVIIVLALISSAHFIIGLPYWTLI